MRILYALFLGIMFIPWQNCHSQVLINEEMKNKLCQEAYGIELEVIAVYSSDRRERVELYPESMVRLRSLISNKAWTKKQPFETLPCDLLHLSVSIWDDQIFLAIGDELIFLDIYFEYPVVMNRLVTILREHKVNESLIPLLGTRLSEALLRIYYDNEYTEDVEVVKSYGKYWK